MSERFWSGAWRDCVLAVLVGLLAAAPAAAAPSVVTTGATATSVRVRVVGAVNPNVAGLTSYHLEYGPTTAYGSSTPDRQVTTATQVDETIDGLSPSTTYHARIVATGPDGTTAGQDQTVETLAAGTGEFAHRGGGPGTTSTWSNAVGWDASKPGRATNEQVAALSFAAGDSTNDVTGVATGKLVLEDSKLTGNAITLGSGGLTAQGLAHGVDLPVSLSADQTWSLKGGQFTASGGLSGAGALTVALTSVSQMRLTGANEVGDVFVEGAAPNPATGTSPNSLTLGAGASLNAASGKPVTLSGGQLVSEGASVGALRTGSIGAVVQVGREAEHPTGSLAATSVTLSPSATIRFELGSGFGTTPGADYGQLSSSGAIDLAGAKLDIDHRTAAGVPPKCYTSGDVPIGTVYTLVSTTAALTGEFAGAPDGAHVFDRCGGYGHYVIDYTAHTVTATLAIPGKPTGPPRNLTGVGDPKLSAPVDGGGRAVSNGVPVEITGGAVDLGVPLTAVRGAWVEPIIVGGAPLTRPVTAINAPQWKSCAVDGEFRQVPGSCVAIPGATGSTFTPGPSEARRSVFFTETAVGSTGLTSSEVVSRPVWVRPVFVAPAEKPKPPAVKGQEALADFGPPAKGTTIRSLLKAGSTELSLDALLAGGSISVEWYFVPAGAKLTAARAGKPKPKPQLVAKGSQTVKDAGPINVVVKLTPAGKKKLKAAKKPLTLTSKVSYVATGAKPVTKKKTFKLKR